MVEMTTESPIPSKVTVMSCAWSSLVLDWRLLSGYGELEVCEMIESPLAAAGESVAVSDKPFPRWSAGDLVA